MPLISGRGVKRIKNRYRTTDGRRNHGQKRSCSKSKFEKANNNAQERRSSLFNLVIDQFT